MDGLASGQLDLALVPDAPIGFIKMTAPKSAVTKESHREEEREEEEELFIQNRHAPGAIPNEIQHTVARRRL